MAGQFPNPLMQALTGPALVFTLFRLLTPRQALNLDRALGIVRPPVDYNPCITTCQSWQPPFIAAPHNDFETTFTYFMHPHLNFINVNTTNAIYAAQVNGRCINRANFANNSNGGQQEPSYCMLPHNHPHNTHVHPNRPLPSNEPLVCTTCKEERRDMWNWRMEKLWHGVCAACRDYVVKNHDPGYNGCTCAINHIGVQFHPRRVNNGEEVLDHMCHEHDLHYFVQICGAANNELWWRRTNERVPRTKRKSGGHGWTRPKGRRVGAHGVLKGPLTPAQRRADTQWIHPYNQPEPVPRCYCGAKIDARGHARQGLAHRRALYGEPLTMRVRSCVGCNGWKRNF